MAADHEFWNMGVEICNYSKILMICNPGTVAKVVMVYIDRHGFRKFVELVRCKNL